MGRNNIEHCCVVCGEINPTLFYSSRKNKCKSCISDNYKNNIDKEEYINKQREWGYFFSHFIRLESPTPFLYIYIKNYL